LVRDSKVKSLAHGPPDIMKREIPEKHLDMAEVEHYLRLWAYEVNDKNDSNSLNLAAGVLTKWRAVFYQASESSEKADQ